eukprot:3915001-Pyramimonas_sp.AAC.1
MYKWTESSDCRGVRVDGPDVPPDGRLQASARALRAAQEGAQRLCDEVTAPPATASASAATPAPTPLRSAAALSRAWILDSGSAHH